MKLRNFKFIGFFILVLLVTVTLGACDVALVEDDPIESYVASITITDVDGEILEDDAEAFSVHYEDGVIDNFEYDEEENELTATVELEGEVDLSLEVDNDEVQGGAFFIIEGEQTVSPNNPDAVFEVEFAATYTASITITDEDGEILEDDAEAFRVYYEDGVIDNFEYDEEENELTATVELEGEVDLSLEVDDDEVEGGVFYIIEGEQTVSPNNPDAVFEVEFASY